MKNITLMAFSSGQESKEAISIPRYIGLGVVRVAAVNPNKKETETLFKTTLDKEPEYVTVKDQDGKKTTSARVDVVLHTVPEDNNGIDALTRMALWVRNSYRTNKDNTKIQVIDKYGRTAWVTKEEFDNHEIPTYSNGNKANIDKDYRPCYQGEEELTDFFKALLNIPSPMVYKDNKWVEADNLNECLARFDNIENLFKGDFSELQTAWKLQQNNKVKVEFGVRSNEGKLYQDFFTRLFLKNNQTSTVKLEEAIKTAQASGAYANTEFQVCALKEYVVAATDLSNSPAPAANPFGQPAQNPFFQ